MLTKKLRSEHINTDRSTRKGSVCSKTASIYLYITFAHGNYFVKLNHIINYAEFITEIHILTNHHAN